jgi:hypothetical protein
VGVEHGLAARLLDARGDRRRVHVVDLAARGVEFLARAHQLVAGRDDPDAGLPFDRHLVDAERGEQPDLARRQPRPGAERAGARRDVRAGAHHVVARRDDGQDAAASS